MFVSVLDAIQGDGFNPLWQEVQVVFDTPNFPCQQLKSDTAIESMPWGSAQGPWTPAQPLQLPGRSRCSYDH